MRDNRGRVARPDVGGGGGGRQAGDAAASHRPVTRLEIAGAIPLGSRRARSQGDYIRALARDEDLGTLRADRRHNVLGCARVLARWASWADRTTRPTRDRICRLASVSVSTWKAARRWLEGHGYLGTVRAGWASWLSPGVLTDPGTPNEAAVYVLAVPRRARWGRPAPPASNVTRPLSSTRRVHDLNPAREPLPRTPASDDQTALWTIRYLRSEVAELRRGPGKNLTDRHALAILRPFLAAAWSPSDIAYAIGHHPESGRYRSPLTLVRQPASWLAWRLSRWCEYPEWAWSGWKTRGRWDHQAWPVPARSPSARTAAAAEASRRAQAERRAAVDQALAAAADPKPWAQRIRAAMGWTAPKGNLRNG